MTSPPRRGCAQGTVNFFNGYRYSDAAGWWPTVLLDTVRSFDVAVGTAQAGRGRHMCHSHIK